MFKKDYNGANKDINVSEELKQDTINKMLKIATEKEKTKKRKSYIGYVAVACILFVVVSTFVFKDFIDSNQGNEGKEPYITDNSNKTEEVELEKSGATGMGGSSGVIEGGAGGEEYRYKNITINPNINLPATMATYEGVTDEHKDKLDFLSTLSKIFPLAEPALSDEYYKGNEYTVDYGEINIILRADFNSKLFRYYDDREISKFYELSKTTENHISFEEAKDKALDMALQLQPYLGELKLDYSAENHNAFSVENEYDFKVKRYEFNFSKASDDSNREYDEFSKVSGPYIYNDNLRIELYANGEVALVINNIPTCDIKETDSVNLTMKNDEFLNLCYETLYTWDENTSITIKDVKVIKQVYSPILDGDNLESPISIRDTLYILYYEDSNPEQLGLHYITLEDVKNHGQ